MISLSCFSGYLVSGDNSWTGAFDWMNVSAAQISILSAAQINGISTNVRVEFGESSSQVGVVEVMLRN
jgi:hypothetical protein